MSAETDFLKYSLEIGALEFFPNSDRMLKSGRMSPYFFNTGLFTTGESIQQLMQVYKACFEKNGIAENVKPDVIYGPAYKGIPLSYALTMLIGSPKIEYAFNRKEEKDHGEGGVVVGATLKGKRILIIDDVMTSGKATRESLEVIEREKGEFVGQMICFDRQETGKETNLSAVQQVSEQYEVPVFSAVNLDDLFELIQEEGSIHQQMLSALEAYRNQYGV